ncbi:hypothetical protein [Kribbella sp. VKM Ac-2566]|uniref:hypothetical protein n=1 Tax=Kribbella sp. VKM Ac-2566 TaxID=2512218 RepID=UPI0010637BE2|nr:hypothetical protein [Kribbella sp. VKM Ac-2566]TDX08412.1 hypothetical protein EV647_0334 [Kribbella sp. VKM Ac-2566]
MILGFARKAAMTGAAVATLGGVAFAASAFAATITHHEPAVTAGVQPASLAGQTAPSSVVSRVISKGMVDGRGWSVALEFYPTFPNGYVIPAKAKPLSANKSSLVCQRMMIGGVRIDHQGGPWADCSLVAGAHDPSRAGEAGLWGLQDKGTSGSRLFVANVETRVAYGVVNLSDGSHLKATATTVPGTSYRAFAVAIPTAKTITTIDTYNTQHQHLTHDTNWH